MDNYYEKEFDEIYVQDCFHEPDTNKINNDDIMDYFVFDENENNIIENRNTIKCNKIKECKNNQEIKVNYNVCSFFSSPIRPDLYCPLGVISGNKYEIKLYKEKSNDEEIKQKEEDVISLSSLDSLDEEKIDNKKIKIIRYFNIENDISVKCKICGSIGHNKNNCPNYYFKFCHRCIRIGHEDKDCNMKKCFKCNKIGHPTFKCPIKESNLFICDRCSCIGHKNEECLINPNGICQIYLKFNSLCCFICGSYDHVLCCLSNRKLPIIQKEETETRKNKDTIYFNYNYPEDYDDYEYDFSGTNIKDNKIINTQKLQNIIFCTFCGGTHRNEECIEKEKFKNKSDEKRINIGKKIIEKRKEINDYNWLFTMNIKDENLFNFDKEENKRIISLDEDKDSEGENGNININNKNNLNKEKGNHKNKSKRHKIYSKSKDNKNKEKNHYKINGGKYHKIHSYEIFFN